MKPLAKVAVAMFQIHVQHSQKIDPGCCNKKQLWLKAIMAIENSVKKVVWNTTALWFIVSTYHIHWKISGFRDMKFTVDWASGMLPSNCDISNAMLPIDFVDSKEYFFAHVYEIRENEIIFKAATCEITDKKKVIKSHWYRSHSSVKKIN